MFSPDSRRLAYAGERGDKWVVVVDGEEGPEFSNVRTDSLVFSPNSQRIAYATRESGKWSVVVDDAAGKQYDRIDRSGPIFSPDSENVAYVASIGTNSYIVINGNEQGFDGRELRFGQMAFSLDSQSVVYGARRGEDWVVTAGGEQKRLGEHIKKSRITFETDSTVSLPRAN